MSQAQERKQAQKVERRMRVIRERADEQIRLRALFAVRPIARAVRMAFARRR